MRKTRTCLLLACLLCAIVSVCLLIAYDERQTRGAFFKKGGPEAPPVPSAKPLEFDADAFRSLIQKGLRFERHQKILGWSCFGFAVPPALLLLAAFFWGLRRFLDFCFALIGEIVQLLIALSKPIITLSSPIIALWIGILVIVLMGLFPPWVGKRYQGGTYFFAGYCFVLSEPTFEHKGTERKDRDDIPSPKGKNVVKVGEWRCYSSMDPDGKVSCVRDIWTTIKCVSPRIDLDRLLMQMIVVLAPTAGLIYTLKSRKDKIPKNN